MSFPKNAILMVDFAYFFGIEYSSPTLLCKRSELPFEILLLETSLSLDAMSKVENDLPTLLIGVFKM